MISQAINEFNMNRKRHVRASLVKTMDESMSAFRPQTRSTGNLPHLSYIMRKPEDLGTEFKVVACPVTGILLYLEIQKGCDAMRQADYSAELGGTAGCVVRLVEQSKCENGDTDEAAPQRELYLGDSWFASVACTVELWRHYKVRFLGPVKTNHGRFPKEFIETTMKIGQPARTSYWKALSVRALISYLLDINTTREKFCASSALTMLGQP